MANHLADIEAELEADGLTFDIAAASVRRVFALVATGREPDEGEVEGGWQAVAKAAAAMIGEGEEDESISVSRFADLLRVAFARAEDADPELRPFDALPPAVRVAWEHVARHAANLFHMDRAEVSRLGQHEDRIVGLGLARLKAA